MVIWDNLKFFGRLFVYSGELDPSIPGDVDPRFLDSEEQ
jgi:hypothetical protein